AEGIEYFLCNTITEVFLVAFRAQIGEWQDRDRADFSFSLLAALRLCFWVGDRACCRTALHGNGVKTDRTHPFQGLIAQRLETESLATAYLTPDIFADHHLARIDRCFDPRRRIDAITVEVAI